MKTKHSKHFYWGADPQKETRVAEFYAMTLKDLDAHGIRSNIHVWRDPAGRRTTVEWNEEK
jgi:hypothetical protein